MQDIGKQRGITMWGLAAVAFVAIFFLFLGFKLLPPYYTDWEVGSALRKVASRPDTSSMSPAQIRDSISKQFDIDYIRSQDLYNNIQVVADDRGKSIVADYSVEIPMAGNISAVLYFSHHVAVR